MATAKKTPAAKKANTEKRGRGRPKGSDSYTQEKADTIIQGLIEGKTLTSISKKHGIPLTTVFGWIHDGNHDDFAERFAHAREFGTDVMEEMAVDRSKERNEDEEVTETDGLDGKTVRHRSDNVSRSRLEVETLLKVVARRKGKDIRLNGNLNTNTAAEIKALPTESLEAIREILTKGGS